MSKARLIRLVLGLTAAGLGLALQAAWFFCLKCVPVGTEWVGLLFLVFVLSLFGTVLAFTRGGD